MQRISNFRQFLLEATSNEVQVLIQKLQAEADANKMRVGGTADKLDWAMEYVVLTAFVQQLQDDLAKGRVETPNYSEDLYNTIEGRSTELKNKAIELMKMNGLSDEAAEELQRTPVDTTQPEEETTPEPEPAQPTQPVAQEATHEVHEAKNWSLVKVIPGSLQAKKKTKRHSKPKSPAEKSFRTAFNHSRNEVRKVFDPKPEPQQPAQPQQNTQIQNQEVKPQV